MTEISSTFTQFVAITDSLKNIVWAVIAIWGIRKISNGINNLIKNFPHFLEEYERTRLRTKVVDRAIRG